MEFNKYCRQKRLYLFVPNYVVIGLYSKTEGFTMWVKISQTENFALKCVHFQVRHQIRLIRPRPCPGSALGTRMGPGRLRGCQGHCLYSRPVLGATDSEDDSVLDAGDVARGKNLIT